MITGEKDTSVAQHQHSNLGSVSGSGSGPPSEKGHDSPSPRPSPQAPAANSPSSNPRAGPAFPPPPNGGLEAWLHVLGGFMLFFNTWGILTSFGVFQTYYESGELFQRPSSDISWIGSIQAFLVQFSGIASGPIYDRGYLRTLLVAGAFCIVFGHMMLSLATQYWQVVLAQGVCVGVGMGCLFVPCISVLPTYFSSRIGFAIGVASSGTSLGGVIYPIVVHRLLKLVGFSWSVRVVGFIALATLAVPVGVMRMRVKPAKPRAVIDWTAFTDLPYMWFALATMIGFMGLAAFQFYFSFYSANQKLTTRDLAFYLVAIYNAASAAGRIIPNAMSDKVGPFNILAPCILFTGVIYFCAIATHTSAGIVVVTAFGGFCSGVFTAMPPVCFAALIKDKSRIGTRIGMGFAMTSFGLLVGGPGGGAILGRTEPLHWLRLWIFAGVTASVAGLMYTALRIARSGFKLVVKA